MKTRWMLLLIGGLAAAATGGAAGPVAPVAEGPALQPMIVTDVSGTLRIEQSLPGTCDNVDQTTAITAGRLELSPAEGIDVAGGKQFALTRASASFAPFSIHRECMTRNVTRNFSNLAVQLNRTAAFTAVAGAPGIYSFTIPKDDLLFFQSAVVNGELQPGSMRPKQDVTGTVDLVQRTLSMQIRIGTKIHFEWGCVDYVGCLVNDDYSGTLTATLTGTIVMPDADGDGVPDQSDNCRFVANPDQSPVATPVIAAPPGITLASCLDHEIGQAAASDLCEAGPVAVSSNAPAVYAIGPNQVTWSAEDGKGRTASTTQTVTVVDTTRPSFTFVPLDLARNNCGPVALGTPAAIDDCAGTPTFTNNAPAVFLNGPTVVTWTARDVSGNATTATQTVTVTDTVPPEISCVPASLGTSFRVVATDACLGPTAIKLGSYTLASGEVVKIEEIGSPGVTVLNAVGPDGIRHFHVGKGEARITATDESGNVAAAVCGR